MKTNNLHARFIATLTIVLIVLLPINDILASNNSPLCFTARNGSVTVRFDIKNVTHTIQYSTDSVSWNTYYSNSDVVLNTNQKVFFRAATNQTFATAFGSNGSTYSSRFYFSSSNDGKVESSGNIMSLYGPDCPNLQLQMASFSGLFYNCDLLTKAPELPATNLAINCYNCMFKGCTLLTAAPTLPATTMAETCYAYMFEGCSSLIEAPTLAASNLANGCYGGMFRGCTSLTTSPELPATTLFDVCYCRMFEGCTSLASAPALPATIMKPQCYQNMFDSCISIRCLPVLPATNLAFWCYREMFKNCSSLTLNTSGSGIQWNIPATTTVSDAMTDMFTGTNGTMNSTPTINTAYYLTSCSYNVAVNTNDSTMGVATGGGQYSKGDTATITAIANYGYHFTGWSDGVTSSSRLVAIVSDTAFEAIFAANQFTIATSAQNGSVSGAGTYDYGTTVTLVATPDSHYHFTGWSDGCVSQTRSITVTANATYIALFEIDKHLIVFKNYDNSVLQSDSVNYGNMPIYTSVTPSKPTTAQYTYSFKGWNPTITNVTGDATYIADFDSIANSYTISVIYDASKGSASGSGSFYYGQMDTLTATPNAHYHFASWSNGDTTQTIIISVYGDSTFIATFEPNQYTVTVNTDNPDMGTVTGGGTFDYGSIDTLTATARLHFHFVRWSNGDTTATTTVVVGGDTTITAIFAYDQYLISAVSNDTLMGNVTGGGLYNYGATATLIANANEHYHFVSWNNGATSQTIIIPVYNDSAVTAIFEADIYSVVAKANYADRGIVTGGGQFYHNDIATLTATPNTGYVFSGWDNGETDRVLYMTVASDTVITAIFEPESTPVDNVEGKQYIVYSNENNIHINGAAGEPIRIYDINGKMISEVEDASDEQIVPVYVSGVYFVRINDKKSVKVVVK